MLSSLPANADVASGPCDRPICDPFVGSTIRYALLRSITHVSAANLGAHPSSVISARAATPCKSSLTLVWQRPPAPHPPRTDDAHTLPLIGARNHHRTRSRNTVHAHNIDAGCPIHKHGRTYSPCRPPRSLASHRFCQHTSRQTVHALHVSPHSDETVPAKREMRAIADRRGR